MGWPIGWSKTTQYPHVFQCVTLEVEENKLYMIHSLLLIPQKVCVWTSVFEFDWKVFVVNVHLFSSFQPFTLCIQLNINWTNGHHTTQQVYEHIQEYITYSSTKPTSWFIYKNEIFPNAGPERITINWKIYFPFLYSNNITIYLTCNIQEIVSIFIHN